jgi:hypothetical protein
MRPRKIIAILFFAIGMALFFNKGYLNPDLEHPFRSLMASLLLTITAAVSIIFGSKEEPEEHHHT